MSALTRHLRRLSVCAAALCAGCSSMDGVNSRDLLIPAQTLNVSKSLIIPAESMAAGAVIYLIVDPLAPNWQIEERKIEDGRYQVAMKKKRFTTGGDGEAAQVFYRRAAQLARDHGDGRYRVVSFTEGVESTVPVAQRVAQGIVEVTK